jgi:hypothetical protein
MNDAGIGTRRYLEGSYLLAVNEWVKRPAFLSLYNPLWRQRRFSQWPDHL